MPSPVWIKVVCGDEVAILPRSDSPATDVLDIVPVGTVGPTFIKLSTGALYAQFGGAALYGTTYIVRATDEHRAALKAKRR